MFAGAKNKQATNDVVKGDAGTKSLVVYFTRQGEIPGDMDAISAATPNSNKDMDGSDTEAAARMIQSLTGADMYQIHTNRYYRKSFMGTITVVFDVIGWVLIKHPWSLTFKEFYIDYQPWITIIAMIVASTEQTNSEDSNTEKQNTAEATTTSEISKVQQSQLLLIY